MIHDVLEVKVDTWVETLAKKCLVFLPVRAPSLDNQAKQMAARPAMKLTLFIGR